MGGTMRLGLYPCQLTPGTIAQKAYQEDLIQERHRHRFEFNNDYREIFEEYGMRFLWFITRWSFSRNCGIGRSSFYVKYTIPS